jgi:hypothetical protein
MDQLRRRAESASGGLPTANGLAEAIEAVRRVVERHPDLNITLYGEQGEGSAEVRIGWEDGVVRAKIVSVEGPDGTNFGPGDGPLPVLPAEIPPMTDLPRPLLERPRPRVDAYPAGRRAEPAPVPEAPRLLDPRRLADRRRRRAAPDPGFLPEAGDLAPAQRPAPPSAAPSASASAEPASPSAWTERAPATPPVWTEPASATPSAWTEPASATPSPWTEPAPATPSPWTEPAPATPPAGSEPAPAGDRVRPGDLPLRSRPRVWQAEHDDNPEDAAARLAAMIREDPSLLARPEDR